jgi:hypothetical protein
VVESLKVPAQPSPAGNRAGRLLPHVLEAAGHAQRLGAVPDRAVRLLTIAANDLRDTTPSPAWPGGWVRPGSPPSAATCSITGYGSWGPTTPRPFLLETS